MKPKVYIATSYLNADTAKWLGWLLTQSGAEITYPWWALQPVGDRQEVLSTLGSVEEQAIRDADLLIALLPARRGGYIELGVALGAGVPVAVFYTDDESNEIPFVYCSGVVCLMAAEPGKIVDQAIYWWESTWSHRWHAAECVQHGVFQARLAQAERPEALACPSCGEKCPVKSHWPATESGHGASGDGGKVWQTMKRTDRGRR